MRSSACFLEIILLTVLARICRFGSLASRPAAAAPTLGAWRSKRSPQTSVHTHPTARTTGPEPVAAFGPQSHVRSRLDPAATKTAAGLAATRRRLPPGGALEAGVLPAERRFFPRADARSEPRGSGCGHSAGAGGLGYARLPTCAQVLQRTRCACHLAAGGEHRATPPSSMGQHRQAYVPPSNTTRCAYNINTFHRSKTAPPGRTHLQPTATRDSATGSIGHKTTLRSGSWRHHQARTTPGSAAMQGSDITSHQHRAAAPPG